MRKRKILIKKSVAILLVVLMILGTVIVAIR